MLARKQWRKAVFPLTTAMICRLVVQEFEDGLSLVFVFGVLLYGMLGIRGAAWLACEILVVCVRRSALWYARDPRGRLACL